jgi:hypothetical protein
MAKTFSIAWWNVEYFKGDPIRSKRELNFHQKNYE